MNFSHLQSFFSKTTHILDIYVCMYSSENWILTMTHSNQSGLGGAVGSELEVQSEGCPFKFHSKQIFALTLKLLIDYISIKYFIYAV